MTDTKDPILTAALLAQTGSPIGPPPNDKELQAWAERTLNERRREEVESHIAHDPLICERAVTFLGKPAATSRSRSIDELKLFGMPLRWVGVACALLLSVSLTSYLRAPQISTVDVPPRVERSAATGISDWRLAAFMSGYLSAEQAQRAMLTDALQAPVDCLDADQCAALPGLLQQLGATAQQLARDCRANGAPGPQIEARLKALAPPLRASLELAPWSEITDDLLHTLQQQPRAACDELQQLQERNFTPQHTD